MSRIQQLDPQVVNRIAAGEVIERPASVVKELLENSVDALSTRITVDIVDGGLQLIRVSDDGEGIHRDDMLLAVTSHATSKIRSDADLDHVSTLGFRGEALASIASVSRFRVRTRQADEAVGRELECSAGQIVVQRECGCPEGTVMEVHNLFFNTPVRRRFLKKATTEFGHISEYFARIALANPALHLVLRHNEKLVYELPGTGNQLERIRRFFGGEIADKLISIQSDADLPDGQKIRLWGFVGEPSLSKATRRSQYLFLNGRAIQDRSLQHALEEAYRGLLMVGRHPVSFLFLEIPPALVDVNVHPTKTEVRFQDSQLLYRHVLHALRDRFLQLEFRSSLNIAQPNSAASNQALRMSGTAQPDRVPRELDLWASAAVAPRPPQSGMSTPFRMPGTTEFKPFPDTSFAAGFSQLTDRTRNMNQEAGDSTAAGIPIASPESVSIMINAPDGIVSPEQSITDEKNDQAPVSSFTLPADVEPQYVMTVSTEPTASSVESTARLDTDFRALQIHDCYLVVAGEDGIEVIDQHALHERILYEHLRLKLLAGNIERQRLLIPDPIECSAAEAAVLCEHLDLLREIGFELQEFGGTTMLLTAYPVLIPRGDLAGIVRNLAEQLEQTDGKTTRRDLLDHMLHTMACRAAIKSGQRLTQEEMQELLRQRHLVNDSHHCPHGRPTSLTLTRGALDQQFGRLG